MLSDELLAGPDAGYFNGLRRKKQRHDKLIVFEEREAMVAGRTVVIGK
jgi:hypothetical protein